MFAYIALIALCIPSLTVALSMATCPREANSHLVFNPTRSRCDANYMLGCLLACMCVVYVTIWLIQNTVPEGGKAHESDPLSMGGGDPFALAPSSKNPFSGI